MRARVNDTNDTLSHRETPRKSPPPSKLDLTETEAFLERQFAAGMQQGMQQGIALLLRQFSRRLGRALTDDERAVVTARLNTLGADRLGDVVLDLSALDLAVWLADPAAR